MPIIDCCKKMICHSHFLWEPSKMMCRSLCPVSKRFLSSSRAAYQKTNFFQVSDEVKEAISSRKPVVALESTIITHGMPYPHNFSTALSVERRVRENGAIPATVAVMKGKLCVGLTDTDLIWLAEKNSRLVKISRRDLAHTLSQGLSGGTTVSATMIAAHMAGIAMFATGGIGGVHRGAETSFDVSADLTELGRTPVAVVSSGVKSILDIPKTLEYLETQGVCVATYGEVRNFPAFFSQDSGHFAPYNVRTQLEAAQLINTQLDTGLDSGCLIAVPIPEEFAATGEVIQNAINEALELARENTIMGKEVTPYVLNLVNQLTAGESLVANIALVENNASMAGGIAHYLAQLQSGVLPDKTVPPPHASSISLLSSAALKSALSAMGTKLAVATDSSTSSDSDADTTKDGSKASDVHVYLIKLVFCFIYDVFLRDVIEVVIGTTVVDFSVRVKDPDIKADGATYPGQLSQSFGGVGRNLADGLSRLACNPAFVSALGTDSLAAAVVAQCSHMDFTSVQRLSSSSTATYCPILHATGQLLFGVGDMDINEAFDIQKVSDLDQLLAGAPIAVLDSNYSVPVLEEVVRRCNGLSVPVWFEPTDLNKSKKPFATDAWQGLTFVSPNLAELVNMHMAMKAKLGQKMGQVFQLDDHNHSLEELIKASVDICRDLVTHIPVVLLTLGRHGVLLCHGFGNVSHLLPVPPKPSHAQNSFKATYYRTLDADLDQGHIASVSGAGDCLASAFIAGMLHGLDMDQCVRQGLIAASLSLQSNSAVPDILSSSSIVKQEKLLQNAQWQPVDVSDGQY